MATLCVTVGGGCGLSVIVLSQTDSKPQIRLLFELEISFVLGSFGVTYCTLWRLGINTLLFAHSDIVAKLGRNWLT